jgi:intracellular septation protein
MVAIIAAMLFSAIRYGRISPLLWFSGVMVLVLGGLTIVLHKEWIIKVKPTVYYTILAGTLGFGLATGRPLLQQVLGSAYPGLDSEGWRKLTRNWALFFACLAVVNEAVWRNVSTDAWIAFKLWFVAPATLVFAGANIPMLLKHGLMREDAAPVEPGPIE